MKGTVDPASSNSTAAATCRSSTFSSWAMQRAIGIMGGSIGGRAVLLPPAAATVKSRQGPEQAQLWKIDCGLPQIAALPN
jgi:hypothetical protein